ncbi:uncharacterized protein JCM10292_004116, partial [Rhodotorula paludigena]|uniref:uncharacterized protein n=1 Tax=Rhodotorula paludigena TaxID=86838 RepID=UPI003175E229
VRDVQKQAIADILPALRDEDNLSDEDLAAGEELLRDRVTVFRFCRRARFSPSAALNLLHSTVHWRLTSSLHYLEVPAIAHTLVSLLVDAALMQQYAAELDKAAAAPLPDEDDADL